MADNEPIKVVSLSSLRLVELQRDAARMAAHLLYKAHALIEMDTDEDTVLQRRVLAEARTFVPDIDTDCTDNHTFVTVLREDVQIILDGIYNKPDVWRQVCARLREAVSK